MTPHFQRGKRLTFVDRIHSFPPILCRLLARHKNGAPMTADEIAEQGGNHYTLSERDVDQISKMTDWEDVKVPEMILFTRGCGINFCEGDCKRVDEYLRTAVNFEYLRKHPDWKDYYLPLLKRWRQSHAQVPGNDVWPPVRNLLVRLTPLL